MTKSSFRGSTQPQADATLRLQVFRASRRDCPSRPTGARRYDAGQDWSAAATRWRSDRRCSDCARLRSLDKTLQYSSIEYRPSVNSLLESLDRFGKNANFRCVAIKILIITPCVTSGPISSELDGAG